MSSSADPATDYDAIVLGAGSGGLTAAVGFAGLGRRTALVERGRVGGDCTNVGCIPSKTLIHLARDLPASWTPARALAEVRARRDRLAEREEREVEGMRDVELVRGAARFVGPREVEVALAGGGARRLRARTVVIATGSSPVRVPIEGLPEARALTNETLFDLDEVPAHLAVVGAGVVGAEMAFAFRRLGAEVTVVDASDRVLPPLEPEAGELVRRRMEARGIRLELGAKAVGYREEGEGGTLLLERDGAGIAVPGVERVLLAVGRRPNLDLGLDAAGVTHDPDGIPTDPAGRTDVEGVWAIGDVSPRSSFTHSANAQGRRAVRKAAFPFLPLGPEPIFPSAVFTEPEVAQVGPPLRELAERFPAELIRSERVELAGLDRGYAMGLGPDDGFVLIHALRLSGRVLSATVVGPHAGEMVPLLTLAIERRVRLWSLAELVFPYPTLSEGIKKAASAFAFSTLPELPRELGAYLRLRLRGGARDR